MSTNATIFGLSSDLNSLLKSLHIIVCDSKDSLVNLNAYMSETKKLLDKNLNIWIKLAIKNNDPVLSNTSLSTIIAGVSADGVFSARDELWLAWKPVREDVALRHGLPDPGDEALPANIIAWCSGIRHILSDTSRFEGVSAKVSGKTKLLKLIKPLNDQEGIAELERLWSIIEDSLIDNLDIWLHAQKDLIPVITKATTSKQKKDVLLYARRLIKLNDRKKELDRLLILLDFWQSNILSLLKHSDEYINLEDFQWFATCCRKWSVDVQQYCYNQDSKLIPDVKLMKVAFSKIKIKD